MRCWPSADKSIYSVPKRRLSPAMVRRLSAPMDQRLSCRAAQRFQYNRSRCDGHDDRRFSTGNARRCKSLGRTLVLPLGVSSVARNTLPRSMDVFDFAEPSMVIGQRESSNTADQALFMLNNPMVIEQSDALARRLLKETESTDERIEMAFRLVFGRGTRPKSCGVVAIISSGSIRNFARFLCSTRLCRGQPVLPSLDGFSRIPLGELMN